MADVIPTADQWYAGRQRKLDKAITQQRRLQREGKMVRRNAGGIEVIGTIPESVLLHQRQAGHPIQDPAYIKQLIKENPEFQAMRETKPVFSLQHLRRDQVPEFMRSKRVA